MYIETTKRWSDSLHEELKAVGLVFTSAGSTTRRIINGKIEKGYPRSLHIADLQDSDIPAVQAVLDAHVPDFGHVASKIEEVKVIAGYKIESVAPLWRQVNRFRENGAGDPIFTTIDAIRVASDEIEAEILALSDEDAGNYDVVNNPLWP